jgi:hypothetical protein
MRPDLERLVKEHDSLTLLTDRLIGAVIAPSRDIDDIVQLRNELAIVLHEHLAKEDGFLYAESLRASAVSFGEALTKFEQDFAKLSEDWQQYLTEWPSDLIAQDIEHFSETTVTLLTRLKARITHENALLYPLALQQGRISLRA